MADSALETFATTFGRATSQISAALKLIEVINNLEEEQQIELNDSHAVSDMARFGVVLAVAAMDDYFTRKYAEVFVPVLKRHGLNKHCSDMLEDAGLDIRSAIELLTMDRPYSRLRKLAQDNYSNYTTQNVGKIDDLFKTIGITKLSLHAQNRSKRKTLISSIDKMVKRRHKIVHTGDLTRTAKLNKINITEMQRRFADICLFVSCADKHIEAYKKQKIKKS
jgi:hypothetical protein